MLPSNSSLGQLEIIEVYDFFDQPLLFLCRNLTEGKFLTVLVSETKQEETWYLVNVSKNRFVQIRSGGIDLHDAFVHAENGFVHELIVNKHTHELLTEKSIPVEMLSSDNLPAINERLSLETQSLPTLEVEIHQRAQQGKREHLLLDLDFTNIKRTEAPAYLLGSILSNLQELINAIGQTMVGKATERGVISSEIIDKTKLHVVRMGAGSFQIELAAADYVNLFNESDLGQILDEFILLLDLSARPEELKDQLTHLKIRAASKYLQFLQSLKNEIKETQVTWASPKSGQGGKASLSSEQVKLAIQAIEKAELQRPEYINFLGKLIGANIERKTYEIHVESPHREDHKSYSGYVSDEALSTLIGATLGGIYSVTIMKLTNIKPLTGDVEEKFELIKLLTL